MCNSAASHLSCPVCPLRTRRTLSFLTPWGICLLSLSLENSTRHQLTMRQREPGQHPMGESPVILGLPLCPVTFPVNLLALQQSPPDRWGSSSLRCLWTVLPAQPRVHQAHGVTLIPMILWRCVSMYFCYSMMSTLFSTTVHGHVVCFCEAVGGWKDGNGKFNQAK